MSMQGILLIDGACLGLLFLILNLVRKQKLSVGTSAIWLLAVAALMSMISVPALRAGVTAGVGATYPASAMTLLAFVFIFLFLIFFSVQLSTLSARQIELVQALAMRELLAREGTHPQTEEPNRAPAPS
jgi:hypothetical protein